MEKWTRTLDRNNDGKIRPDDFLLHQRDESLVYDPRGQWKISIGIPVMSGIAAGFGVWIFSLSVLWIAYTINFMSYESYWRISGALGLATAGLWTIMEMISLRTDAIQKAYARGREDEKKQGNSVADEAVRKAKLERDQARRITANGGDMQQEDGTETNGFSIGDRNRERAGSVMIEELHSGRPIGRDRIMKLAGVNRTEHKDALRQMEKLFIVKKRDNPRTDPWTALDTTMIEAQAKWEASMEKKRQFAQYGTVGWG